MKLRNWIEKKIGKRWANPPAMVGRKGSEPVYEIDWEDGTTVAYHVDWDEEEIREVWAGLVRRTAFPHDIITQ